MQRGWGFWSGEDNICNMQMISWVFKGLANLPLDKNLLSKTKNVWLIDKHHQKDSAYTVLHPLTKVFAKSKE